MRLDRIMLASVAVAALFSAGWAASAPEVRHYGPFPSTSPDSGTCGNFWATDTFDRFFRVQTSPNADGTYSVTEQFKDGSFVTDAGPSPGGCDTNPGGTVAAGVTGQMQGSFLIVITGGTYNPAASCDETSCGTTAGFVATVFVPEARYDVPTFRRRYNARTNGEWKNASADRGGNQGDITGTP